MFDKYNQFIALIAIAVAILGSAILSGTEIKYDFRNPDMTQERYYVILKKAIQGSPQKYPSKFFATQPGILNNLFAPCGHEHEITKPFQRYKLYR